MRDTEVSDGITARSSTEKEAFVLSDRTSGVREVVFPRPQFVAELDVVPARLLQELSAGRLCGRLVRIDPAAGHGPMPADLLVVVAQEEDRPGRLDDRHPYRVPRLSHSLPSIVDFAATLAGDARDRGHRYVGIVSADRGAANEDSFDERLLAEQIHYYEERAPIYEQLYFLQGRYQVEDPAVAAAWRRETAALEGFVEGLDASGAVLELACGNGLWTRFLAPRAEILVAVDSSNRMIERNREWVGDPSVRYVQADLFTWDQPERFDLIFAGFFLSHVPPARWNDFWQKVARWLAPGGVLAFVDDVWGPDRPRSGDRVAGGPDHAHIRRLDDAEFTIVKRFFRPEELVGAFATVGLDAQVNATGEHFLFGTTVSR